MAGSKNSSKRAISILVPSLKCHQQVTAAKSLWLRLPASCTSPWRPGLLGTSAQPYSATLLILYASRDTTIA